MGMKEYVLWGGGAVVAIVVLHGLWKWFQSRRPAPTADDAEVREEEPQQLDILDPPLLMDEDVEAAEGERREPSVLPPEEDAKTNSGRRVQIAGKRTEPTKHRERWNYSAGEERFGEPDSADADKAPEDETAEGAAESDAVVIWVTAPQDATLEGAGLLTALTTSGLQYGDDGLFRKYDQHSEEELFTVANGIEPGTFDLANLDELQTPGIVLLLRLQRADHAVEAFQEMLDAAQELASALGAELKDEHMSDLSAQVIEHCRQRIRDFKRRTMRT